MSFSLGVFDGSQLVPSPQRTHRTPTSFWVTFSVSGRARYSQGPPPAGIPHGPFETKKQAHRYVKGLSR